MDLKTNSQLSIEAIEKAQYPWNKHVPFLIKVIVNEDNITYMQITPQANAGTFKPKNVVLSRVPRGVHTYKFIYIPTEQGTIQYTFSVAASTKQTNFAASDSGNITFNSNLIRTPITSGYMFYQLGGYTLLLGFLILLLFGAKKGLYFLRDKLIPTLIKQQTRRGI